MTSQRTFPRPPALETSHLSEAPVLDELELVAWHDTDAATWSRRVLKNEQRKVLKPMLGDSPKLPQGLLAAGTDSLVIGLTRDGLLWEDGKWVENDEMWGATTPLSADDVAFVARAFTEGCDSVLFRPYFPLAWIPEEPVVAAAPEKPAAPSPSKLPPGAKLVAIVDDLDKSAVLELIALAPGPVLLRRHDGNWFEDDDWLIPLRSIDPPPIVVLEKDVGDDVIKQVDESTKGMDFVPKVVKSKKLRSSAFMELDDTLGQIEEQLILRAAVTPEGIKGTEKLKRYWTVGEGGLLKIRWGTPGSWTRCQRHLRKYIGPRAAGYCTNLCQRMGGFGVACHVGVRGDAAPLIGVGTYTPGMFKLKPEKGGRTPYAREDRKTTRTLSDAEIEQRREAARKSAEARRKSTSESRSEAWRSSSLSQKVKMAAAIELAAIRRKEELQSLIRGTDDPLKRAQYQGELDDINNMLSAKDEWLRNQRYDELKLADKQIDDVQNQLDRVREGFKRQTDSLTERRNALDLQIEAARNASSKGRESAQAANERERAAVGDLRSEAASLRERAANTTSEVQRIQLMDQARRLSDEAGVKEEGIKRYSDANAQTIDKLVAQRRGISTQISDINSQRTRKVADMNVNLKKLRDKRSGLTKQYQDASEYLRRSRSTGAPGQFFI